MHSKAKWVLVAVGLCGAGAFVGRASAGNKSSEAVAINTAVRIAYGSVGSARNSADSIQWIGCSLAGYPTAVSASCSGSTATGITFTCIVPSTSKIVDVVKSIQGDSRIRIEWDAAGTCTRLDLSNDSRREPKVL